MKTLLLGFTGILLTALLFSTQLSVSSCTKEKIIHDTIVKPDLIGKHINDSLWAYYPIQGNIKDSSGNNHILVLNNGASLTYDKHGNDFSAIDFNGFQNYASIADGAIFPNTTSFSLAFVIMPRENRGLFIGKQDYNTARAAAFNVGIDNVVSGDIARFSITTNQSQICTQPPTTGQLLSNLKRFNTYAWYHVIATFNNGTMKLYVNGNLVNTRTIDIKSINSCPNGQFILANWWSGDHNGFNGKMDEIRIYTRMLSDIEAKYLFDKCSIN